MPETTPKLLIVDDQAESLGLLVSYLENLDLDIRVAKTGEDGLALAAEEPPDVFLLDVEMPGLNGFAVCRRIRENPRFANIPVIFLSGKTTLEEKLQGFSAGAVDYITKPFSQEEVLARISVQLTTKRRFDYLDGVAKAHVFESFGDPTEGEDRLFAQVARELSRLGELPHSEELLAKFGVNERRLNRLFRERTGMTWYDYATELRLYAASKMLVDSNIRVQTISDRVGYRNPGDFSRAFRRRFGVSPREFRQARRGTSDTDDDAT